MIFGMNGFVDIPVGLQYVCNSKPKGKYHLTYPLWASPNFERKYMTLIIF